MYKFPMSKKQRGEGDLLFIICLIGLGLWELWDHPYQDRTTLFYENTVCYLGAETCQPIFGTVTFRLIPETQSVVGIVENAELPPFSLTDCIVLDKKNWDCQGRYFANHPIGRIDGKWTLQEGYNAYRLKSNWLLQKWAN